MSELTNERRHELLGRPFLFIEELVELLETSRATVDRARKGKRFPLREIPKIDRRIRFAGSEVRRLLKQEGPG